MLSLEICGVLGVHQLLNTVVFSPKKLLFFAQYLAKKNDTFTHTFRRMISMVEGEEDWFRGCLIKVRALRSNVDIQIADCQKVDKMTDNVDKITENVDKMTENVDTMTENVNKMAENVNKMTENVDIMTENVPRQNE
jgi:hypothetical protein